MTDKIEITKANAFEFDPSKKYLLVFDNTTITMDDVGSIQTQLNEMGMTGITVVLNGNINSMKVMEQ